MLDDLSAAFKALGHPHRLTIVRSLLSRALRCCAADRSEDCRLDAASCNVGELAELLDISAATASHHLKELDRAGLIERVRDGRQLMCRVNGERLAELMGFLGTGQVPGWPADGGRVEAGAGTGLVSNGRSR